MAGMGGVEPPKCESQSLVPYHLATSLNQSSIRGICNYHLGSKLRRRTLHASLNFITKLHIRSALSPCHLYFATWYVVGVMLSQTPRELATGVLPTPELHIMSYNITTGVEPAFPVLKTYCIINKLWGTGYHALFVAVSSSQTVGLPFNALPLVRWATW